MSSNIEQGTKTLGQALGLAAQPVSPGFGDQDRQAAPSRNDIVKDVATEAARANGHPVTSDCGPDGSKINIREGTKQLGKTVSPANPVIASLQKTAQDAAKATELGFQKLVGKDEAATTPIMAATPSHTLADVSNTGGHKPRFTTITGAPTDNPLARSAIGTSKRQLADVSGIEESSQSSAEKGLSV